MRRFRGENATPTPEALVPLIRKSLDAGADHYRHAGELLRRAKAGLKHGEWLPWLKRNFELSAREGQRYIALASGDPRANTTGVSHLPLDGAATRRNAHPVCDLADVVVEAMTDAALVEAMTEIVTRGYRACALDCHPDTGGAAAVMAKVTAARDQLMQWIQNGEGRITDRSPTDV